MVQIVFLRKRQVSRSGLILALFVLAFVLSIQARGLQRRFMGVKPGVMLENFAVAGLLPHELTRLVRRIAPNFEREPQNAMLFTETGEVIPENGGLAVDVAGTIRAVFLARPNERVHLVVQAVAPAITREYFEPVFQGPRDRPEVALAINVAWGEESLPGMLDVLKREKAAASFFFVGDFAEKFPELVQAVARAGHEVANHGLRHDNPRTMTREQLTRLILDNEALLARIIGRRPARLFAPPAGEFDRRTVGVAAELGYRSILWTVDTIDWQRPSPDLILARVVNKVSNGAIILIHPTAPTLAALPGIIAALRERGYRLVTVGRMLGAG